MSNWINRLPFGISVLLGFLSCALLLAIVANLAQIVKWTGYVFLWLPARIGIVETASPSDIITADFSINPTPVTFPKAGAYNLYTNNLDLLELADATEESTTPWLVIQPAGGSEGQVPVRFITRGLAPFDTPFAKGRPIFYFIIDKPGNYTLRHPSRPTQVNFVPDYTTGKERLVAGVFIGELLVIGLIGGSYMQKRWKVRAQAVRQEQSKKKARANALFEKYRAQQEEKSKPPSRRKRW